MKRRYASALIAFGLLVSLGAAGDDDDAPAGQSVHAVVAEVRLVSLRQQLMSETVTAYGQVAPDARQVMTVSVPRAGQVTVLYVVAGQAIRKGEPLLAFTDAAETAQAWQQARLALDYARKERARTAQLLAQQLATAAQLAAADQAVADAQAAWETQRKIGAGHAVSLLRAPCDAWVMAVPVSVGERMAANVPLLQLSPGAQQALLSVEAADSRRLRTGMPVQLVSLMGTGATSRGQVVRVAGALNPQTRQVDVAVSVPQADFLSGERVRGEIRLQQHAATVVPRSAVLADVVGHYIYQVRNGRAWRIAVQTGLENAEVIAVDGAFLPGAPVVATGNYELQNGMAVRTGTPR